ncbi:MAG: hypothetical protein ACKVPZ_01715 [Burkholderiaceae bacterium]
MNSPATPIEQDSLVKQIFTDPHSGVFNIWVNIINFWIFISCLSLAGETLELYAADNAAVFHWIEIVAVTFFTLDYIGNLYFAKDRIKYFFSFWGLVDLISCTNLLGPLRHQWCGCGFER